MKKKTTIKSIIIAVIVVAVACAGFFVYKNSQTKEAVKINSVKDRYNNYDEFMQNS